ESRSVTLCRSDGSGAFFCVSTRAASGPGNRISSSTFAGHPRGSAQHCLANRDCDRDLILRSTLRSSRVSGSWRLQRRCFIGRRGLYLYYEGADRPRAGSAKLMNETSRSTNLPKRPRWRRILKRVFITLVVLFVILVFGVIPFGLAVLVTAAKTRPMDRR